VPWALSGYAALFLFDLLISSVTMAQRQDPIFAKSIAAQIDYSNYVSAKAVSQGNLNQATDAPDEYQLNPLDDLENVNDFDNWLDDINRVLRQKGL
jgi:hypothetical protein